jgi:hypothetical protein
VTAETKPDEEIVKKLEYIKDHTHEKIDIPLTTTELIILRNLGAKFGKMIEFRDNEGKVRELPLHMVIRYAKESYFEMATSVVKIAKKYSLDIPTRPTTGMIEIPTVPDLLAQPQQ